MIPANIEVTHDASGYYLELMQTPNYSRRLYHRVPIEADDAKRIQFALTSLENKV